ncbi:MAG TPA: 5-deoxy-glucuronate isomerase, partial [Jatrophihabitantaceae bacterium]|nr:5-deoxy-glucuronate isomerase [Jatrophihabitantaceae bacterium]
MIRKLIASGVQTDLIDLDLAELTDGEQLVLQRDGEVAAVVLSGVVDVVVDGASLGAAGGRSSVFEAPGDAIYAPPGRVQLTARGGEARVAIASAPLADQPPAQARIIRPENQRIGDVGDGNWGR